MSKVSMLERFAAQSLVEYDGELIFSKEKFAELIVRECAKVAEEYDCNLSGNGGEILEHFGVEE